MYIHSTSTPTLNCLFLRKYGVLQTALYNKIKKDILDYNAGPRSAVGSASDSRVSVPRFDTRSGDIFSFLLPLIYEELMSVTGECMFTNYWFIA